MKKISLRIFCLFCVFLIPSLAHAYIDLEVGAITVSPSQPAQNEPCTITVRVINNSDVDLEDYTGLSASDINANFRNFSITKTNLPNLPIPAETTVNYTYEGSFSDTGRQSLYFRINANNSLAEGTSGNNYTQDYVEIVEPYDYKVNSIDLYPPYPMTGEEIIIKVEATNNGFISFKTNQDIGSVAYDFPNFDIEETIWPEVSYEDKIETDEEYYYQYRGEFTQTGETELSYTLDTGDKIEEKDEENNYVSKKVEIFSPEDMDLEIYDIDFDIERPLVDEEIEIKVTVRNSGDVSLASEMGISTTGNANVIPKIEKGFFADLDDINLVAQDHDEYPTIDDSLDPGHTFTYTYIGKFHFAGEKNIEFIVNQREQLIESDYNNNASSTKITIYQDEEARDKFKILDYDVRLKDSETVEIVWQTDQDSTGAVWYKKKGYTSFVGETLSSSNDTTHSVILNDLSPDTLYEFTIISENGTEEETLEDVFFTTPANNTVLFTQNPSAEVEEKNVTITWKTNLISYSQLFYRTIGDSSYRSKSINKLSDVHSINLQNLNPGNYEYYVKSASTANTESSSENYSFTIEDNSQPEEETTEQTTIETDDQKELGNETEAENQVSISKEKIAITNQNLYNNLKGKIILTVETNGEAYYINPQDQSMNYLGRPDDAFSTMRNEGVGISNENLEKIEIGLTSLSGADSDQDGLSDLLEDSIGTDKTQKDSDNDGHDDKTEILGNYDPTQKNTQYKIDSSFAKQQVGKIFLQVEKNGEAWYINPQDNKRYFLGRPADAFSVMRNLGLGISNQNFNSLN
jgi:hypothetical protein